MSQEISQQEIEQAQQQWGEGIVQIGKAFIEKQDFAAVAKNHIETLYAYGKCDVLFKPTKAAVQPFRQTPEAALSYFVACNDVCTEDKGFAIQPWTKVRFENHAVTTSGNMAMTMGHYFFTDLENKETKVEYSFGYIKGDDQKLRICLHHSSVPFGG